MVNIEHSTEFQHIGISIGFTNEFVFMENKGMGNGPEFEMGTESGKC